MAYIKKQNALWHNQSALNIFVWKTLLKIFTPLWSAFLFLLVFSGKDVPHKSPSALFCSGISSLECLTTPSWTANINPQYLFVLIIVHVPLNAIRCKMVWLLSSAIFYDCKITDWRYSIAVLQLLKPSITALSGDKKNMCPLATKVATFLLAIKFSSESTQWLYILTF